MAKSLLEKQADFRHIEPKVRTPKIPNEHHPAPSRRGKKGMTVHFPVDAHRALKEICLEQDTSVTALLFDGINMVLQKYGRKPIA